MSNTSTNGAMGTSVRIPATDLIFHRLVAAMEEIVRQLKQMNQHLDGIRQSTRHPAR